MTISRMILLQKATRNLLKDASFANRWVPLKSIKKGLEIRYKFNTTYPISKLILACAISKIEPMIENLVLSHPSGLYRAKIRNETLYYQQKAELEPPSFFVDHRTSKNKETESNLDILLRVDSIF